ncbi:MAG TPA: TonB family protein [Amaricoccus sp.]|uniref:energy transducer TonB n=1 Tax=Amaricoccus sp. TaxID=1872485 RepID=UPI002BFD5F0C|nr:TonB family protein [Amaricoccus sp.]HMQ91589.1 TonB family protein [Amaricoccus sp.]HMR51123.1 TonB family protein [Amaricoccus sp.]HMR59752.1 TonB family protein [Amaricoccus sp.]HMT98129.1 TonB family protein [Amaricoccus sp.]
MSAADAMFLEPDRPGAGQAALWLAAAGVAVAAHSVAALLALRQPAAPLPELSAPPAITIDLAPMPVAPQAADERVAPDLMDAPEIDVDAPDSMAAPVPPAPAAEAAAPDAPTTLPPPPELQPTPMADVRPAVQPEVVLPEAEPAETRPLSRPDELRVVEAPKAQEVEEVEEVDKPRPAQQSRAAARAQVRTEQAEATAAPRPATGNRGVSPAKWQAQLMAHLERLKRYPSGARRRREEGVVLVRFRIDDRGAVQSAQLMRSSGHAELDEAVLALIRRASPVPAPPPGAPRSITAPVRFDVR